jgi:hypothetical protein
MFHLGKYPMDFDGIWSCEFTKGSRVNLISFLAGPAGKRSRSSDWLLA